MRVTVHLFSQYGRKVPFMSFCRSRNIQRIRLSPLVSMDNSEQALQVVSQVANESGGGCARPHVIDK